MVRAKRGCGLTWRPRRGFGASGAVLHLDIDLTDRDGNVRVAFNDLALRLVADGQEQPAESPGERAPDGDDATRAARGVWQETGAEPAPFSLKRDCDLFLAGGANT